MNNYAHVHRWHTRAHTAKNVKKKSGNAKNWQCGLYCGSHLSQRKTFNGRQRYCCCSCCIKSYSMLWHRRHCCLVFALPLLKIVGINCSTHSARYTQPYLIHNINTHPHICSMRLSVALLWLLVAFLATAFVV